MSEIGSDERKWIPSSMNALSTERLSSAIFYGLRRIDVTWTGYGALGAFVELTIYSVIVDCWHVVHRYKIGRTVVGAGKVLSRMRQSTNVDRNADVDARMKNAWDSGVHDGVFASPIATITLGFEWMLSQREYRYITAGLPVFELPTQSPVEVHGSSGAESEDHERVGPCEIWESVMYVLRDRLAGVLCCSPRDIQVEGALRTNADYIANWSRDRLWPAGTHPFLLRKLDGIGHSFDLGFMTTTNLFGTSDGTHCRVVIVCLRRGGRRERLVARDSEAPWWAFQLVRLRRYALPPQIPSAHHDSCKLAFQVRAVGQGRFYTANNVEGL